MRLPTYNEDAFFPVWLRDGMLPCGFAIVGSIAVLALFPCSLAAQTAEKPDAAASRTAFLQVYRVLTSPRCQNCHPAGDAPLQGDDSHTHLQNVKRGKDGHGVSAMRCDTCHQATNLAGDHLPPGNPKSGLPSPHHKLVFFAPTPPQLLPH